MPAPSVTLADAARRAAPILCEAGFTADEAARETNVLARARLGWDQAHWLTAARRTPATPTFVAGLEDWVRRRAAREPSAYITGRREFFGRDFRVSPAVLIPRPETELVITAALGALAPGPASPAVLDVGTGSGCLAVTLALELPRATVVATDVSAAALAVATGNARQHGVDGRVRFEQAALTGGAVAAFDLVVSNPPYVPAADRPGLPPDVRDYEPALALFGGDDGLDVLRALIPAARRALRPTGVLVCEIGAGQAGAVAELVTAAGLRLVTVDPDLAGTPRVVVAAAGPV